MKHLFFTLILLPLWIIPSAQNVGIDVALPLQKLDVNGAIKIGATATNQPGAIRYNAGKFEGGDGVNWKSFEGTTSGIVGTKIYNNPDLINAGYSLFGEIPGVSTYNNISNTTFSANTWQPMYLRGIAGNVSAPPEKLPGGGPDVAVFAGSLMYVATSTKLYSYDPLTDVWNIVSNQGVYDYSTGVWTGTEIIFWSGSFGSRYNPATNIWMALPATNAPSYRGNFTMVWDGLRVIIWGGLSSGVALNTGAMYNTSTNTWTAMNTAGAPTVRYNHTAIWNNTSGRMIIWGGSSSANDEVNTGSIFNPTTNSWAGTTNSVGAPALRTKHTAIWTGTDMIIFGGLWTNSNSNLIPLNDGYKYNYSTNTWTAINMTGAPLPRYNHTATWTGTEMFVTGGFYFQSSLSNCYGYNPITDLWIYHQPFNDLGRDGKDSHYSFLGDNMILIYGGTNTLPNHGLTTYSNTGYRYFLANTESSSTTLTTETLFLYQKN